MSDGCVRCEVSPFQLKRVKRRNNNKKKNYPRIRCELAGLFSSQSEPKWMQTLSVANWCYEQLKSTMVTDSYRMPVTWLHYSTCFISLQHNQQCCLISMCSPVHMPIKLGNQAAEQRHGKMFTDILFNLPNLLHFVGCSVWLRGAFNYSLVWVCVFVC